MADLRPAPSDDGGGPETPAIAEVYRFASAHLAFAVQAVDQAMSNGSDNYDAAMLISEAEAPDLEDVVSLRRELCRALTYRLDLALGDEDPGCELKTEGYELLPPMRDLPEPVLQLWRAVAAGVTQPAAIARFEDLLWCRRDGNAGAHAARAAQAYLDLSGSGEIDMCCVTFLVRAWTIARQIRAANLDRSIRERMAAVAAEVLDTSPGESPGVLLPLLGALAQGPMRPKRAGAAPDPIDVDDLLARAAATCGRGPDASTVARYRRGRTHDHAELHDIASEEVAAYFRDADAAAQPAVRMLRLQSAARIAGVRGLNDLKRDAVTAMQSSNPADLGMQTVTAASALPAYVVEGMLSGFTSSRDWHDAMDRFLTSECPTGGIADLRALAAAARSPLIRSLPTVLFAGGLPRATADTPQEREKHEMSFAARVRAEAMGRLLAEGLDRLAARYGIPEEDALVDYLLTRGGGDPALARSVAKAFRHFWTHDYESCIHLATPKFEAAARSLLIEFDEGIYRVEADKAKGGYPGLYVLLNHLEDLALDESWAYFFGWLLGGPWGANVRNDVAHGLPTPMTPTYAALVLRAVCVLAVVAGPSTSSHLPVADRRPRDEVLALLSDLSVDVGPAGNLLARLAAAAERVAWRLRLARLQLLAKAYRGDASSRTSV